MSDVIILHQIAFNLSHGHVRNPGCWCNPIKEFDEDGNTIIYVHQEKPNDNNSVLPANKHTDSGQA